MLKAFHQFLQSILLNYITSRHVTAGHSPSQLIIKWQFRLPLTVIQPPLQVPAADQSRTDKIAENIEAKQAKMKSHFEQRQSVQSPTFSPWSSQEPISSTQAGICIFGTDPNQEATCSYHLSISRRFSLECRSLDQCCKSAFWSWPMQVPLPGILLLNQRTLIQQF